jgi:hypothetical protein
MVRMERTLRGESRWYRGRIALSSSGWTKGVLF